MRRLRTRAGRLRRRIRFLRRRLRPFLAETAQSDPGMPMGRRLRHIIRGYHPLEASWYEQVRGSTEGCVSNYHRETGFTGLNGEHGYLLGNKLVFAHVMNNAGFPHPRVFGFTHRGTWHWLGDGRSGLAEALASGGRAVVKPVNGRKGASIEFIAEISALDVPRPEDVLVSAFVQQADYAARIFPGSLNTIRVLTVVTDGGAPLVAATVHRFGSSATRGVDNFSAGGMVARVHLETGVLDKAVWIGHRNRLVWSREHPDTRAPIEAVQVPHWEELKRLALGMCAELPFLKYVGWDIAVTDQGPVVIEGNAHPSLRFFQLYEPMLGDGRLRPFFAAHMR